MRNRVYGWPARYGDELVKVTAEVVGEAGARADWVCIAVERSGQDITGEVIDLFWLDAQRAIARKLDAEVQS